jgi:hypothetical protein
MLEILRNLEVNVCSRLGFFSVPGAIASERRFKSREGHQLYLLLRAAA